MFDVFTGWKIGVETVDVGDSYIIVPAQQVVALCLLLTDHSIPHAVEGAVPAWHHAGAPSEPVIRLGPAVEAARVQAILDSAP
jgi:hypothetical protein